MKICVFGASSDFIDADYFRAAEELGARLAQGGHQLVFGGGRGGLMGACARGVLGSGGTALGIAPLYFDEPGILMKEECDFIFTDTLSERKKRMEEEAEAFIALPGGIGTYEEFFEVLTLKQLGRHDKPMGILNTLAYYDPFLSLLRATAEKGFMSPDILSLFLVSEDSAALLTDLCTAEPSGSAARDLRNYWR